MQVFFLFLAAILLVSHELSPFHYNPWVMFSSEMSTLRQVYVLAALFYQNIKIPRAQLLLLPFILIPVVQWAFGLVFDFSTAFVKFTLLIRLLVYGCGGL